MRRLSPCLLVVVLTLLGSRAGWSQSCFTDCFYTCNSSSFCSSSCTDNCGGTSHCGQYGICDPDPDDDGYAEGSDNCPYTYNPNQANCDGDSAGDACDSLNANYSSGSPIWCHIVGRDHFGYVDVQLHYEVFQHDTSSCGAPDRWLNLEGPERACSWPMTQWECCFGLFGVDNCALFLNHN